MIQKYTDVIRNNLLEGLLPKYTINYNIIIGDTKPVNINLYPLSDKKIRK
jgi:hypothetical protein